MPLGVVLSRYGSFDEANECSVSMPRLIIKLPCAQGGVLQQIQSTDCAHAHELNMAVKICWEDSLEPHCSEVMPIRSALLWAQATQFDAL